MPMMFLCQNFTLLISITFIYIFLIAEIKSIPDRKLTFLSNAQGLQGPKEVTQENKVCVSSDVCGKDSKLVDLDVSYYCNCDPGFQGQYCEYSSDDSEEKASIRSKYGKFKMKKTVIKAEDNGEFCVTVVTYCINGQAVIDYEPVCAADDS
ncbi:hypothetical protein DdX_13123 [Ditylenchus destructor]|uniref:EGF-like domain-containing protein n=1 Tax=Ditylenchus destructor TaxID=166010 RepID=A0AAD4MUF3_9BILA|nr:hypothetical protein DdX_13123 [Ditylenchus destructor]